MISEVSTISIAVGDGRGSTVVQTEDFGFGTEIVLAAPYPESSYDLDEAVALVAALNSAIVVAARARGRAQGAAEVEDDLTVSSARANTPQRFRHWGHDDVR
jgi:hypothetical protein